LVSFAPFFTNITRIHSYLTFFAILNPMNNDYILPIGSIVHLKDGNIDLMITSRAQLFNDKGRLGYFDYAAVFYPTGVTEENKFVFFNREDIQAVIFEGYRNEEEKHFSKHYDEEILKVPYPKLGVNSERGVGTKTAQTDDLSTKFGL